jgi:hypothetical protein
MNNRFSDAAKARETSRCMSVIAGRPGSGRPGECEAVPQAAVQEGFFFNCVSSTVSIDEYCSSAAVKAFM